jgi:hypothetical protein
MRFFEALAPLARVAAAESLPQRKPHVLIYFFVAMKMAAPKIK